MGWASGPRGLIYVQKVFTYRILNHRCPPPPCFPTVECSHPISGGPAIEEDSPGVISAHAESRISPDGAENRRRGRGKRVGRRCWRRRAKDARRRRTARKAEANENYFGAGRWSTMTTRLARPAPPKTPPFPLAFLIGPSWFVLGHATTAATGCASTAHRGHKISPRQPRTRYTFH